MYQVRFLLSRAINTVIFKRDEIRSKTRAHLIHFSGSISTSPDSRGKVGTPQNDISEATRRRRTASGDVPQRGLKRDLLSRRILRCSTQHHNGTIPKGKATFICFASTKLCRLTTVSEHVPDVPTVKIFFLEGCNFSETRGLFGSNM